MLYFFLVYRAAPSATQGFELPGANDRRRIKQLQAQIHHLDKALAAFTKVGRKFDILGKTKQEIIAKYGM